MGADFEIPQVCPKCGAKLLHIDEDLEKSITISYWCGAKVLYAKYYDYRAFQIKC